MAQVLPYRPSIEKEKLLDIIVKKLHYKMNRFIDEAVKEKIVRETIQENEIERLGMDIGKFLYERNNWKVYAPGPKLKKELDAERKKVKSGKVHHKELEL